MEPEERSVEKPTWEQLMADPEYNRRMQETVKARLKDAGSARETLDRLRPVLDAAEQRCGVSASEPEELARRLGAERETRREQARAHFEALRQQEASVKAAYPGFSLERELKDPRMVRLTAPGSGVDLRTAYEALHREEIGPALMAYAARRARQKVADAVRAGSLLPPENGLTARSSAVMSDDPRKLTREQRQELRRRVRDGEKICW